MLGNEHVHVCACASTVASAAKALPAVMAFQALAGSMVLFLYQRACVQCEAPSECAHPCVSAR